MTPWGEPDLRGVWPLNHIRNYIGTSRFERAQKK